MQKTIILFNLTIIQVEGLKALFRLEQNYNLHLFTIGSKDKTDLIKKSQVLIFENNGINEAVLQTLEFIKKVNNKIKFIALGHDYEHELMDALQYSDVFLDSKSNFKTLLLTINKLIIDGVFIDALAAEHYIKLLNKTEKIKKTHLTKRETEVLELICKEKSAKEISILLDLSVRTVENHRKNILSKTSSKGTAGLVIYAIKNKLFRVKSN